MDGQSLLLLLWAVAISAALLLLSRLARGGLRGGGPFLLLLAADVLLAAAGIRALPRVSLPAVAALALFGLVVLVPAALAALTQRAMASGRFGLAARLVGVRRLLQPGVNLGGLQAVLERLQLAREGRVEEALAALSADLARPDLDDAARPALVEQALALYLYEERWQEAIDFFERAGGRALADASPGLCASLLRAFAELGRCKDALACLERLEAARSRPGDLTVARLTLLAHLGATEAVARLLSEPRLLPGLTPARAKLWLGVAAARAGDLPRARALWGEIVADPGGDRGAQAAAERRLASPPAPVAPLPPALAAAADAIAARALAEPPPAPARRGRLHRVAPASTVIIALLAIVHIAMVISGPRDAWTLLAFGANFPLATLNGEPFRLVTSIFLHGGWLHLAFNAYALAVLGRLAEPLFGSVRFVVIFVLAGIAGAAGSALFGHMTSLSVGASGAILGLLGAPLVAALLLRGRVPEPWRRRTIRSLLLLIGIQLVVIDQAIPYIDRAAHVSGLAGGALVALPLVPRGAPGPWARRLVAAAGVACVGLVVASAALAATWRAERMLARLPRRVERVSGLVVAVPAHWRRLPDEGRGAAFDDPLLPLRPTAAVDLAPPLPNGVSLEDYLRLRLSDPASGDPPQVERMPSAPGAVLARRRFVRFGMTIEDVLLAARTAAGTARVVVHLPARHAAAYAPVVRDLARSLVAGGAMAARARRPADVPVVVPAGGGSAGVSGG